MRGEVRMLLRQIWCAFKGHPEPVVVERNGKRTTWRCQTCKATFTVEAL